MKSWSKLPAHLRWSGRPSYADWKEFGGLLNGELRQLVVDLNDLLANWQRHFGYRVANEIGRLVVLASQQSARTQAILRGALDIAILEKVLPKFHGAQQELQDPLQAVFAFAIRGKPPGVASPKDWHMASGHLTPADTTMSLPLLPRTAAKVWRMLHRLGEQNFASFIE